MPANLPTLRLLALAAATMLGFLAAASLAIVTDESAGADAGADLRQGAFAMVAASALGAVLVGLAFHNRERETVRDALVLAAAGAWTGAGFVAGGHPLPPLVGLLAALVVMAGSREAAHRGVAMLAGVGAAAAACLNLPEAVHAYRWHLAVVATGTPVVTVALVDGDRILRALACALVLTAALGATLLAGWRAPGGATLDLSFLLMAAGLLATAGVAARRQVGPHAQAT